MDCICPSLEINQGGDDNMKNRKFLLAFIIIGILSISFFVGGRGEVVPLSPEDMNNDVEVVNNLDLFEVDEDLKDKDKIKVQKETDEFQKDILENNEGVEKDIKEEDKGKKELPKEENKVDEKSFKQDEKVEEKPIDPKDEKENIVAEEKKNKNNKDKYLTDPVPEGKPKPVEWQDVKVNKDKKLTASLSVTCKSILNNMDMFNMDKIEVLPEDGIVYPTQRVTFNEGESVFDVLLREMQKNKIHMEFVMTPIYNSNYVEGINNLYEFDCGELSGWMYRVNGWFPNYGCSRYLLEDGDVIEWIYTCDLGRDIGGDWAITGGGS